MELVRAAGLFQTCQTMELIYDLYALQHYANFPFYLFLCIMKYMYI